MNKERLLELADFIESHEELRFNMALPFVPDSCGTAGCIGGFAGALWPEICARDNDYLGMEPIFHDERLREKLAMTRVQFKDLCYPKVDYSSVSRTAAVLKLRNLAANLPSSWPHIMELAHAPNS